MTISTQPPFTQASPIRPDYYYPADGNPTADHPLPLPPTQTLLPAAPLTDVSQNVPPAHRRSSAKPVAKVAGARRPVTDGKGKGKAPTSPTKSRSLKRQAATDITPTLTKKARGRSTGAANYRGEDLEALMDIAEEIVPIGKKGWNTVGVQFAEWAKENGRPARTAESIERKFKQVVQMEKPTGRARLPFMVGSCPYDLPPHGRKGYYSRSR